MIFILWLIIAVLVAIIIYLITQNSTKIELPTVTYDSTLYWQLLYDLDKKNAFAPWEELLMSKLVDPEDFKPYLYDDKYVARRDYSKKSGIITKTIYNISDLLFVHWSSSQESWDHLAGRKGYVVISKSEKRQIDFIMTRVS